MRRPTLGLLAVLVSLAACKVEAPVAPVTKRSVAPAVRSAGPDPASPGAPAASVAPASPGASASGLFASPEAEPQALRLTKPAIPVKTVVGKVLVDASYLVAAGVGNILSHNGGLIVAAGGGNLLSQNGGQIISQNGGQIVAAGAGNVIVNNSGNLISQNGGQIIGPNGGQLVAAGAGNYALAQAAASPSPVPSPTPSAAPPEAGTQLPAAGMELRARSLRDGKPLPLGEAPDGTPVYAVYSNAEGGYEVFLPESEDGNVLLEARVPTQAADARLTFDVLTDTRQAAAPASAAPGAAATFGRGINEESAIATDYIRTCLVSRFVEVCQRDDIAALVADWGASEAAVSVVGEFVRVYRGLSEKTGLIDAAPAEAEKVARRCLDITLSRADLHAATVPPDIVANWEPPATPPLAVEEIMSVIAHSRDQTAAKMQADPDFLATWPFTGTRVPGFKPRKASDPATFVVREYLVSSDWNNLPGSFAVLKWAGAYDALPGMANDQGRRLNVGAVAMAMYVCTVAVYDDAVKKGCEQAFADWQAGKL